MKKINGKSYYISLGYVEEEKLKGKIDAKDIESINLKGSKKIIKKGNNITVYVDDTDKDNIIAFPLAPVNDIQYKDGNYRLTLLFSPNDIDKDMYPDRRLIKINVAGLFEEYKKDNMEYIKPITFFKIDNYNSLDMLDNKTTTMIFEIKKSKIIGE